MSDITADQLFNYLLKDAKLHKQTLLDDIARGDLAADTLNSEILASNNIISDEVNPDNELDRLDDSSVFGDPYTDQDWLKTVTFEQIDDDDIAEDVFDNIKKGNVHRDIESLKSDETSALHKYANTGDTNNILNVHIDRMLNNIRKNNNFTDDEKMDLALRLLFNLSTRDINVEPVDIRLDQDDVYYNLDRAGLINLYQKLDPTFMERERITNKNVTLPAEDTKIKPAQHTDYQKHSAPSKEVPLTYISDKDGDIQLYTPSKQANTVYNIFKTALLNDIKNGNAPDTHDLNKYIQDTFTNKLKAMSYDDWEKEIALMHRPDINLNNIRSLIDKTEDPVGSELPEDELSRHIVEKVRKIKDRLRSNGYDFSKNMRDGFINAILVANDYEGVPDDLLTKDDFGEFLPDNPKLGKSRAEIEDSKLNRWHGHNKEQYKKYLAEKARSVDDSNSFNAMLNKGIKRAAKRSIYKYVFTKYPILGEQLKKAKDANDTETIDKLIPTMLLYREILDFKNSKEGRRDLDNWASNLLNTKAMNKYGIEERSDKHVTRMQQALKESEALMDDGPKSKFEESAFDTLQKLSKEWKDSFKQKSSKASQRAFDDKLLATLPTDMADRLKYSMEEKNEVR